MFKNGKFYCDYCGKEIKNRCLAHLHRAKRHFCNKEHRTLSTINKIEYQEDYVEIYVNYGKKEMKCLVDIEDYENKIKPLKVKINVYSTNYCYFRFKGDKTNKKIKLHRYIMNCEKDNYPLVDHINRNPLDNRKSNLRYASYSLNRQNTGSPKNNVSGEKGVFFNRFRNKWIGSVCVNNKRKSTKYCKTKDECILLTKKLREEMQKDFFNKIIS